MTRYMNIYIFELSQYIADIFGCNPSVQRIDSRVANDEAKLRRCGACYGTESGTTLSRAKQQYISKAALTRPKDKGPR